MQHIVTSDSVNLFLHQLNQAPELLDKYLFATNDVDTTL